MDTRDPHVQPTTHSASWWVTVIAAGVIAAVLAITTAIWVITIATSANDAVDCAAENVQRVLDGLPEKDCPDP